MTILTHIILSVALFYIINWIGKNSYDFGYIQLSIFSQKDEAPAYNFILRAFSPVIYIIIISYILHIFNLNNFIEGIWGVTVYYFIFRWLYNVIFGRFLLINWISQIIMFAISVPTSFYVYKNYLISKIIMLPNPETLVNEFWIIVILFIYSIFNKVKLPKQSTLDRKKRYITNRYKTFKDKYNRYIKELVPNEEVEILVYAIMIYETFNRPKIARIVENIIFPYKVKTLGVMQVTTDKKINDLESVIIGAKKIVSDFNACILEINERYNKEKFREEMGNKFYNKFTIEQSISCAILKYNKCSDYKYEVLMVYRMIKEIYSQETSP